MNTDKNKLPSLKQLEEELKKAKMDLILTEEELVSSKILVEEAEMNLILIEEELVLSKIRTEVNEELMKINPFQNRSYRRPLVLPSEMTKAQAALIKKAYKLINN